MDEQEKHHWNVVIILSDGRTVSWQMMCSTLDMVTEEVREFAAAFAINATVKRAFAGSDTHRLMEYHVEDMS
jgi:hypothetical protein